MLNYTSFAALIAAFNSGKRFQVSRDGRIETVTNISINPRDARRIDVRTAETSGAYGQFRADGTNGSEPDWFLIEVPTPETAFPFSSVDALIAAFNAGVKFEVTGAPHPKTVRAVTKIAKWGDSGFIVTDELSPASTWGLFALNGRNSMSGAVLRVKGQVVTMKSPEVAKTSAPIEDAVVSSTGHPLRVTESGSVTSAPLPKPDPAPTKYAYEFKNWMSELAKGTKFYCPATGEDVTGVSVSAKGFQVMLAKVGVSGATPRHSNNYRADGSHKHVVARSLIVKPAPVEPTPEPAPRVGKSSRAAIFKNRLNKQLFVVREGEVLPPIRGVRDAELVGETTIVE